MRAWLLGSGGWFPTERRQTTSVFVREGRHGLVLDAGTGLCRLLTDRALLERVTAVDVVLTHFHLDHTCGLLYLPGLFSVSALARPPSIWAPGDWLYDSPSRGLLDRVLRPPISPFPAPVCDEIQELRLGKQQIGPFEVATFEQPRHWGPTAGLRVGDELALITDTARELDHARFVEGVTHLLHEAWSPSSAPIFADHDATGLDAARTAAGAGVDHLTLMHLNPLLDSLGTVLDDARAAFADAQLGEDGAEL